MTREETIVNLEKLIALFHTASEQSKKDGLFRNTVSHIRACMRIVGEDDAWYWRFQKELNRREALKDG